MLYRGPLSLIGQLKNCNVHRLTVGLWTFVTCMLASFAVHAHHGWPQFDTSKAYYLEGTVESIRWTNPHPSIVVSVPQRLEIPSWLSDLELPRSANWAGQTMPALALPELLAPVSETGKTWTVILAPTTRLSDWGMKRSDIALGQVVRVVGFAACDVTELELRPEFVVLADRRAIRQRSVPLPSTRCSR